MLDLNNPQTNHIFTASGFLSRLKTYSAKYSLQSFAERQETFLQMLVECSALHTYAQAHFKDQLTDISKTIEKMNLEIERLAKIDLPAENGNCKVCNTQLETIPAGTEDEDPEGICEECSNKLFDLLYELEKLTGVIGI